MKKSYIINKIYRISEKIAIVYIECEMSKLGSLR